MPRLTPSEQRRLARRLARLEYRSGARVNDFGGCDAPPCTPDDLRKVMAILWEAGALYTPPDQLPLPPQRGTHDPAGRWMAVADGDTLQRAGQHLRALCGLRDEELAGRNWGTGVWPGEQACRRLLGWDDED